MNAVPGPRPLPIIGTAYSIDPNKLIQSDVALAKKYPGGILKQEFPGHEPVYMIYDRDLVDEICDESRFYKKTHAAIRNLQRLGANGLFTGETADPEWQKAHRILMPAFGPQALTRMYDSMTDIAEQLVVKWARKRPGESVDVAHEFTKLTLDTICITAFSHRLNGFYTEETDPFVESMVDALSRAASLAHKPPFIKKTTARGEVKDFEDACDRMLSIAEELVDERRENPHGEGEWDILDEMLNAEDVETGEKLTDDNIIRQMVTLLVAGHETTSGLLSFAVYELIKNPKVLREAQELVDEVLGGRFPQYDDLKDLGFIDQVLRETLRIYPTAPAFGVTPYEPTRIGVTNEHAGYAVQPGDTLLCLIPSLHKDPKVWANPDVFDPERFSPENTKKIPQNAWKPFGNGERSCIGRGFALQEAALMLILILQNFDMRLEDEDYELSIMESLSLKPENLRVIFEPRRSAREIVESFSGAEPGSSLDAASISAANGGQSDIEIVERPNHGTAMRIAFGSESGTASGFAERLCQGVSALGFAPKVSSLDALLDASTNEDGTVELDTTTPLLVVTASYEGLPPRNAARFHEWLMETDQDLSGLQYAVFGVGNSDWGPTFQRVPSQIDETLDERGGQRIADAGRANVRSDFEAKFNTWSQSLWHELADMVGIEIDTSAATSAALKVDQVAVERTGGHGEVIHNFGTGIVESNDLLSTEADGEIRRKRAISFSLPAGQEDYRVGDYLEVIPQNSPDRVNEALVLTGTAPETVVRITGERTFLPAERNLSVGELLRNFVDLNAPAPMAAIEDLAATAQCPPEAEALRKLASDDDVYFNEVADKRVNLLDLARRNPSASLSIEMLIQHAVELTPRTYSIASASEDNPGYATIVVSVVDEDAWSGEGAYKGAASSALDNASVGTPMSVRVSRGPEAFAPVFDKRMLMFSAGSGMSPFRGFVNSLSNKKDNGQEVIPAWYFYGCHGQESDNLYADEHNTYGEQVVLRQNAFSRHPESVNGTEVKYVQDLVHANAADIISEVEGGAHVFVCGGASTIVPGVREAFREVFTEHFNGDVQEADRYLHGLETEGRFIVESFT